MMPSAGVLLFGWLCLHSGSHGKSIAAEEWSATKENVLSVYPHLLHLDLILNTSRRTEGPVSPNGRGPLGPDRPVVRSVLHKTQG